jgi:hypothetical protein
MTYTELTAAMWDGRRIEIGTVCANPVYGVPITVDRRESDDTGTYWRVYYRTDRDTVASLLVMIDSFDGH